MTIRVVTPWTAGGSAEDACHAGGEEGHMLYMDSMKELKKIVRGGQDVVETCRLNKLCF